VSATPPPVPTWLPDTPTWMPTPARTVCVPANLLSAQLYFPPKMPSDALDYTVDWTSWEQASGLTIQGGNVRVEAGSQMVVTAQYTNRFGKQSAIIGGGLPGTWRLSFQGFTTAGRSEVVEIIIVVLDQHTATVDPLMTDDGQVLVIQNGTPLYTRVIGNAPLC
jgi:hypothetical protein